MFHMHRIDSCGTRKRLDGNASHGCAYATHDLQSGLLFWQKTAPQRESKCDLPQLLIRRNQAHNTFEHFNDVVVDVERGECRCSVVGVADDTKVRSRVVKNRFKTLP